MYAQYSRMSNMVALGEKTIEFYLEKAKYYQGKLKSKKFRDKITSETYNNQAYCFDYDMMNKTMNFNLIRSKNQDLEIDNKDMNPKLELHEREEIKANNDNVNKIDIYPVMNSLPCFF